MDDHVRIIAAKELHAFNYGQAPINILLSTVRRAAQ